ncbi:mucoidy inhibitor MuiA family protein [Reyranella sp. CPCC 100927]|uniref:mucoidy inhibitor MuiA family protein n=1 Tax=Reyranella sp. CPCC 100927 TaxID=2599616 RepID=UPI0011B581DB|nr:mucoidy inhibitor MuiA family protein [Reyranella sp. CPCC 100927]TWT05999.1 mucoidy inhibitor MuiA family protein [Reyranella sp. CPCC 100927]
MRAVFVAIVLAAIAGPSLAADIEAASRVDTVTVYPDGASVTRRASVTLPSGASTIILKGLPPSIDPASIRVAGEGSAAFVIGSVETRSVPGDPRPVIDAALEEKLRALRDRRDAAAARFEATDRRRAMIRRYAEAGPEKLSPEAKPLDVAQWPGAWDAVGSALAKANEDLRLLTVELRGLDEEIAALERARPKPPAPGAPRLDVSIALEAPAAMTASMTVTYRVTGAQWRPLYDARLDTGGKDRKPSLELVRRAEIVQRTGEPWTDVVLLVSTVRVARSGGAPDLASWRVDFVAPPALAGRAPSAAPMPAPGPRSADAERKPAEEAPAQEQEARVEAGAFQASFAVPGRITIPQDGSPKAFRISSKAVKPDLSLKTVPVLDPTAYLEAAFVNEEDAPLLPGQVAIHRDGIFVGRTALAMVAPGDKVRLAFGADDRVKVTRVPVARREEEPGFLGSSRSDLREFKTVVKNLHDFPVRIAVQDRVPVADNTAITVEMLSRTTPPTEKVVDDKRGVMGWTYDYGPGEQKEILIAYRLKWPADRDIRLR